MKRTSCKDLTLQQLRSFCATARLGSLKAAAESLRLSNPTVWEHVHALESYLNIQLIESHKRGCRLTESGRTLDQILGPIVHEIDQLKRTFHANLQEGEAELSVAATPRAMVEDLPEAVVAFKRQWPRVKLTLAQVRDEEVAGMVESGKVDLGFSADRGPGSQHSRLSISPCYSLDYVVVMPASHALARKRSLRLEELRGHPLINAPESIGDPSVRSRLESLGLFESKASGVEAFTADAIRRYVQLDFGIGLIGVHPTHRHYDDLVVRSLKQELGSFVLYQITRKGVRPMEHLEAFIGIVKATME